MSVFLLVFEGILRNRSKTTAPEYILATSGGRLGSAGFPVCDDFCSTSNAFSSFGVDVYALLSANTHISNENTFFLAFCT